MELLRSGKVKDVFDGGAEELEFHFSDRISVFDKIIPSDVPQKGATLCLTAAHWFRAAEELGIRTHFLRLNGENRMQVKKVRVIPDYNRLTTKTTNYLIPLEWICRHYVAGGLHDALTKGTVRPEEVGFPESHKVKYGEKLPEPYFELTTKLEKVDRKLTLDEALKISGLTVDEYEEARGVILSLDERLKEDAHKGHLVHVDGKKEFAFDRGRNLMLVDTFGTADEDRWWDLPKYREGECEELSKEFVRQYYRKTGYHAELMRAREGRTPEPDIPALPPEVVEEVSALYIGLYERLTGERFPAR